MKKPNNYDNTQAQGEFIPVELGGHTAVIKRVEETTSQSGKPMIKVAIDFDSADSQPEYFMNSFKADTREDKKWPFQGTQYIMAEDKDGNCSKSFKTFVSCVEKSCNGSCDWGDGFSRWFTGKRVGVVYGEVEEEYNGEIKTRRRLRFFCQYDKAKDASIPDKRMLNGNTPAASNNTATGTASFMNIPGGVGDEIPF